MQVNKIFFVAGGRKVKKDCAKLKAFWKIIFKRLAYKLYSVTETLLHELVFTQYLYLSNIQIWITPWNTVFSDVQIINASA